MEKIDLLGKSLAELEQLAVGWNQAPFRGRQLFHWIYRRGARSFSEMTDLGHSFRRFLRDRCRVGVPGVQKSIAAQDEAVRYLLETDDGATLETVFMPEETRDTICLSSQHGCSLDCRFCFTALLGGWRNLTVGEMVGQVLAVCSDRARPARKPLNLVFMGMGEPFLNYAAVMAAVRILTHPLGLAIPSRRITVSTAGITPRIREFGVEPNRPKLAVSLNASSQEQRVALMPITRKYSLADLMAACRDYPLRPRERLTFEYVLLANVNDAEKDAERLVQWVRGIRCKFNLIPYNGGPELPYDTPPLPRLLAFQERLRRHDVPAFIRWSRGRDVRAACGQLSLIGADHALAQKETVSSG